MEDFKTNNWQKLTPNERLKSLQYLEDNMAKECGRTPRKVTVDRKLKSGEWGSYSDDLLSRKNIYINKDYLNSNDPGRQYNAMQTTIHEGRHAYQNDCAKGRINNLESEKKLSSWKKNVNEYNDFGNDVRSYSNYRFQPIEDDANNFAKAKMESFAEHYSSDPNYQNYLDKTQAKFDDDASAAQKRLGDDYKQNIANDINDRYDYKHKTGNYSDNKDNSHNSDTSVNKDKPSRNYNEKTASDGNLMSEPEKPTTPSTNKVRGDNNNNPPQQPSSLERGQKTSQDVTTPHATEPTSKGHLPEEPSKMDSIGSNSSITEASKAAEEAAKKAAEQETKALSSAAGMGV